MRTRAAGAVLGAAVGFGAVAGGLVLPHYFGPSLPRALIAAAGTHWQHPASPSVSAPPQTGELRTSLLLRNKDLSDNGFHHRHVRDTGKGEDGSFLSQCAGGDQPLAADAGSSELMHARWRPWGGPKTGDLHGWEVIGQAATAADASRTVEAAQRVLDECVDQTPGHWRYRKPVTTTQGTIRATIFIIEDGSGKQHGSAALFLDRRRFGALELDTYSASDKQLTATTMTAARRLS